MHAHHVSATETPGRRPRLSVWLAGRLAFDDYMARAERLAWEVSQPEGRGPTLVLCEHAGLITIGRQGSRTDVDLSDDELAHSGLRVRFVGRGGGSVPHASGQVAVSLFAQLSDFGFDEHDVAAYLRRFEEGIAGALRAMKCHPTCRHGMNGLFGNSGQLAAIGIAVRRGVAAHGAYVNVAPLPPPLQRVRTTSAGGMGSIQAERRRRATPAEARSAIVQHLAAAFEADVAILQSGMPGGSSSRSPVAQVSRHVG